MQRRSVVVNWISPYRLPRCLLRRMSFHPHWSFQKPRHQVRSISGIAAHRLRRHGQRKSVANHQRHRRIVDPTFRPLLAYRYIPKNCPTVSHLLSQTYPPYAWWPRWQDLAAAVALDVLALDEWNIEEHVTQRRTTRIVQTDAVPALITITALSCPPWDTIPPGRSPPLLVSLIRSSHELPPPFLSLRPSAHQALTSIRPTSRSTLQACSPVRARRLNSAALLSVSFVYRSWNAVRDGAGALMDLAAVGRAVMDAEKSTTGPWRIAALLNLSLPKTCRSHRLN